MLYTRLRGNSNSTQLPKFASTWQGDESIDIPTPLESAASLLQTNARAIEWQPEGFSTYTQI